MRQSDNAGYVLRVLPNLRKWQYFRDPEGPGAEARGLRHRQVREVGREAECDRDPCVLLRRDVDEHHRLGERQGVVNTTDSAADQPAGRRTVVTAGAKGSGAATGIMGLFDNVTVQVPNPT